MPPLKKNNVNKMQEKFLKNVVRIARKCKIFCKAFVRNEGNCMRGTMC
jgi:hypothetical protein